MDWGDAWDVMKVILFVVAGGAIVWFSYFANGDEPPGFFELQSSVADSQTCNELTTAHDAALEAHDLLAIDDQQMNTLWRDTLSRAEELQPSGDLSAHLRCTGLIGRCPRGTPADICADLLSEEFQP